MSKRYIGKTSCIVARFFDFYVINHVWFWTIGAEKCGYRYTNILPYKKELVIDDAFSQIVERMKTDVIQGLEWSVRDEIHSFFDCGPGDKCLSCNPGTKLHSWCERAFPHLTGRIARYKTKESSMDDEFDLWEVIEDSIPNLTLNVIQEAYMLPGWVESYGGKRWGEACKWLQALKVSKTFKDDVFIIDRIFDLQHNTGFILNKTEFGFLDNVCWEPKTQDPICITPLNYRAKANMDDLSLHCSSNVRNIYTANKNYLPKAA